MTTMRVLVLGATGRTGRPLVAELLRRGHTVTALVRDAARAPAGTAVVVGGVRDTGALKEALQGAQAVISALGPDKKDTTLHTDLVHELVPLMSEAGTERYIGVSGAGIDVAGDQKARRDKVISKLIQTFGGEAIKDKARELAAWQGSRLRWTLVRPPRLSDGPATGSVEHHATSSAKSTTMTRGDLAVFLVDELEQDRYVGSAPFVASA